MRKKIITTLLFSFICLQVFPQSDVDVIVKRKVDSLKRILPALKGKSRTDCLNQLAQGYLWIYEDDQNDLDSGCHYAGLAYNEAKRSNYKKGLGYALVQMETCQACKVDKQWNNNDTEPAYAQTVEYANQAIRIGEDLGDYRMIASAHFWLSWMEMWKGRRDKLEWHLQKAKEYFEKPLAAKHKEEFREMRYTDCSDCEGHEFMLGKVYLELGDLHEGFTKEAVVDIEKAISLFQKAKARSYEVQGYLALANLMTPTQHMEKAIEYQKKAIAVLRDDNNESGELDVYLGLCRSYFLLGDFERGIENTKKSIQLAEKLDKQRKPGDLINNRLSQAYGWMGRFYSIAEDYETAFYYTRKALPFAPKGFKNALLVTIGDLHRLTGNYDSAAFYLTPFAKTPDGNGKQVLIRLCIDTKQYDKAMQLVTDRLKNRSDVNDQANAGRLLMLAAKIHYEKNELNQALVNASKGMANLKKNGRNVALIENYHLLSDIFFKLGKYDSAYSYLKEYTVLKDSVLNKQLYIRLNDYKKEAEETRRTSQIKLLQKDNLIKEQLLQAGLLRKQQQEIQLALLDKNNELKDQELLIKDQRLREQLLLKEQNQTELTLLDKENRLKDQQLNQQATFRNALLGGLLLFLLLGVFVYRNLSLKRKNERLSTEKGRAELQQKVAELEMQALRAQMNPHFIFNCLSSINRFIFKNDNKVASDYLTRFSRLIRMVLIHSQKKLIPLEDELEMIRIYLDLERLRFKDAFDYSITTTNIADPGTVFIPPLLLQPFCENAVWHGLMHKEEKGHLNLIISEVRNGEENTLQCIIEDDGVGREKAAAMNSKSAGKEKSLGLKITKERLALLNQEDNFRTFYQIEDIVNVNNEVAGTRVRLKIKHKETTEEYA